ncbi:hypothetical protein IU485_21130 [Nocardia cyriacigeorgica]|uniref:hypothetical protein n=1 Tax=Nocardia cyriacigeorgica TaxID=135487 RepID=UPI001892E2DF|nr:hypothetical protein [Nocardia cyriacigeorgica]MBF6083876.1 hypothetical protein [Nocardia cyriacigeorgica]
MTRTDETWHRLLRWTSGQAPSERLAAQILLSEGFEDVDPSHPLGGKDGGRDAMCSRNGKPWIMAVYFPRDQQPFADIAKKLADDLTAASKHQPHGIAFVTNQELRLAERSSLRQLGAGVEIELYHLERISAILDQPLMAQVRQQFLDIDPGPLPISIDLVIDGTACHIVGDSTESCDDYLEWWLDHAAESERARRREKLPDTHPPTFAAFAPPWGPAKQPAAMTDEQFEAHLERWRRRTRAQWPKAVDYLAAHASPGLRFRVRNTGNAYLNDVQITVKICGGRGLAWKDPDRFDFDELFPPVVKPAPDPFDNRWLDGLRPKDYPIDWENVEDDAVVVTIDLERLPPYPEFKSRDDDVVLVCEASGQSKLVVEWMVTAQGYGTVYTGEPTQVLVQPLSFKDAYRRVSPRHAAGDDE